MSVINCRIAPQQKSTVQTTTNFLQPPFYYVNKPPISENRHPFCECITCKKLRMEPVMGSFLATPRQSCHGLAPKLCKLMQAYVFRWQSLPSHYCRRKGEIFTRIRYLWVMAPFIVWGAILFYMIRFRV